MAIGRAFTPEQQACLNRIREHLVANLSIGRDDFDAMPVLADAGGWGRANRVFNGQLEQCFGKQTRLSPPSRGGR
jgi:type I restriction enzyme R subunit